MIIHDVVPYLQMDIPRPRFYIQEVLPHEGVMLIYGQPKVKKSWLSTYMGFCVATGTEWLGMRTEQARTLLANFEITGIEYHDRLRLVNRHFGLDTTMLYETSPMLLYLENPENYNEFMAGLRRIQPQVVVMDCMACCFGGDENNSREIAGFIEILDNIKRINHTSIILVHHSNRNYLYTSSVDRARGHSRLTGYVNTLCYMLEQPNGVQLQFKARNARREIPNMNARFQDYSWTLRNPPEREED